MVQWTPALRVGIEEIDAQHQELFRRADRFLTALNNQSRQDVGILLSYLRLYVVTHFGAEEDFMRESSYPLYPQHKAQHDKFVRDLLALSSEHEARGSAGLQPMRIASWLQRWLEEHVSGSDMELARYLLARTA